MADDDLPTVDDAYLPFVNLGDSFWGFDVAKVEALRNCVYVGDLTIKTRDGGWSENPVSVFWQETPPDPSYSNYFGLYRHMTFGAEPSWGDLYVTGAGSVAEGEWMGVQAADGEVIFSRWRHDYRTSADGTAMVDGGRDYFKHSAASGARVVRLRLDGPKFKVEATETGDGA